ncbi:MAG: phosphotransferase [Dongiaceae bacterium]
MIDPAIEARFIRLVRAIDPTWQLRATEILSGGVSAETTRLEIETGAGARRHLVVRRHGPRDLAANPDIAAQEFRLLTLLLAEGMAVPRPVHLDPGGNIFPTPVLVVDHIEGEAAADSAEPAALAEAMADYLARLHRIDGHRPDFSFMPRIERRLAADLAHPPAEPDETLSESRIRAALARATPPAGLNPPALLHGDFWAGNVIWRDDAGGGKIAGAIDWEDSCIGDPLAELGNARFELAWSLGMEHADRLTARYLSRAHRSLDIAALPVWDLYAALGPAGWLGNWGYEPDIERAMRSRHSEFVERALASAQFLPHHPKRPH